jgi:chemotaxis protein methyltransferase CheR
MPVASQSESSSVMPDLTPEDFRRVRKIAYERAGLAIPEGKEGLVRSRVSKRLRERRMTSFHAYFDFAESEGSGDEMVKLIDLLTTNKTEFFREPAHFDYLTNRIIPTVLAAGTPLRIWSAGCSTGEEPYTLSMLLHEAMPKRYDWRILATDLSTRVVASAKAGVYSAQQLSEVTPQRRSRWFVPTADGGGTVVPELRTPISFANLNLMSAWPMRGPFDLILCRNVMIYFDKPTVAKLVSRFHALLVPEGHLFIGHSESLSPIEHRYRYVQPAVYAK